MALTFLEDAAEQVPSVVQDVGILALSVFFCVTCLLALISLTDGRRTARQRTYCPRCTRLARRGSVATRRRPPPISRSLLTPSSLPPASLWPSSQRSLYAPRLMCNILSIALSVDQSTWQAGEEATVIRYYRSAAGRGDPEAICRLYDKIKYALYFPLLAQRFLSSSKWY